MLIRQFSVRNMAGRTLQSTYKLNSGHAIPCVGYGAYQTPPDICESVVTHAFETGYRHVLVYSIVTKLFLLWTIFLLLLLPADINLPLQVDSAALYRNEKPCAASILKSSVPRSELFFTSKIPPYRLGYESTKAQVAKTLADTKLDYVDLFLIHAPYGGREARKGAWKALVEAQMAGKIRSIGVSNYGVQHLDEMEEYMKELEAEGKGKGGVLSVGQWELHPWLARDDIVAWCRKRNVVVEAYSPLVRGNRMDSPLLQPLMKKYGKTGAQILLRWSLQKGFVPLPKSVTPSRIEQNAEVFDFELTDVEMKSLVTGEYSSVSWDPTVSKLTD